MISAIAEADKLSDAYLRSSPMCKQLVAAVIPWHMLGYVTKTSRDVRLMAESLQKAPIVDASLQFVDETAFLAPHIAGMASRAVISYAELVEFELLQHGHTREAVDGEGLRQAGQVGFLRLAPVARGLGAKAPQLRSGGSLEKHRHHEGAGTQLGGAAARSGVARAIRAGALQAPLPGAALLSSPPRRRFHGSAYRRGVGTVRAAAQRLPADKAPLTRGTADRRRWCRRRSR
mmetsp:Transcript_19707/g.51405  ORF Transcript_19707/g.51405 Transcript_19707/m.51405 type:complete len:232 (+) Transcript_19707:245-940(+)